jgi:hypothetical protein
MPDAKLRGAALLTEKRFVRVLLSRSQPGSLMNAVSQ